MAHRRQFHYALFGAGLAIGAPAGWLLLRCFGGGVTSLTGELQSGAALYSYLLASTTVAFSLFGFVIGRFSDRLEQELRRTEELALTDGLTGLRNVRDFHHRLNEECARSERSGVPTALILIDIDHFKAVNDRYGHQAGDFALVHFARTLSRSIRQGDAAFRTGGEEFAILCPSTDAATAAFIAERVRGELKKSPFRFESREEPILASFGVADSDGRTGTELLFRSADAALYCAKIDGRNRVNLSSGFGSDSAEGGASASQSA
jgi:diguanylate cyclase (GGDEF)-like protein